MLVAAYLRFYIFLRRIVIGASAITKTSKFLASQVSDKYRFIGISLKGDKLDEYLVRYQIQFPVYHSPTKDVFLSYKLGSTPQTIVVSNDGKILANWKGAYSKQERVNIEGFFDVHLPGVAEQSKVSQ